MDGFRRFFNLDDANDNLRIIITRHGERVDFTLGKNWLHDYKNGRRDPRIPHLTQRPNFEDWKYDSPLTINGESQSAHIGTKLRDLGLLIDYCYSSPAYRSIQTANKILESQGRSNVPIHVEPGIEINLFI
jgi:broad specificity phosphatase PhoE